MSRRSRDPAVQAGSRGCRLCQHEDERRTGDPRATSVITITTAGRPHARGPLGKRGIELQVASPGLSCQQADLAAVLSEVLVPGAAESLHYRGVLNRRPWDCKPGRRSPLRRTDLGWERGRYRYHAANRRMSDAGAESVVPGT